MADDKWRERLAGVLKDSKTMRSVSLKSGYSAGYVHGILKPQKDKPPKEPTMERFLTVMKHVDSSIPYILCGTNIGRREMELIELFSSLSPDEQEAALRWIQLASSRAGREPSTA